MIFSQSFPRSALVHEKGEEEKLCTRSKVVGIFNIFLPSCPTWLWIITVGQEEISRRKQILEDGR